MISRRYTHQPFHTVVLATAIYLIFGANTVCSGDGWYKDYQTHGEYSSKTKGVDGKTPSPIMFGTGFEAATGPYGTYQPCWSTVNNAHHDGVAPQCTTGARWANAQVQGFNSEGLLVVEGGKDGHPSARSGKYMLRGYWKNCNVPNPLCNENTAKKIQLYDGESCGTLYQGNWGDGLMRTGRCERWWGFSIYFVSAHIIQYSDSYTFMQVKSHQPPDTPPILFLQFVNGKLCLITYNAQHTLTNRQTNLILPKDQWIDVVMYLRTDPYTTNKGIIKIWLNKKEYGTPSFTLQNLNIGFPHNCGPFAGIGWYTECGRRNVELMNYWDEFRKGDNSLKTEEANFYAVSPSGPNNEQSAIRFSPDGYKRKTALQESQGMFGLYTMNGRCVKKIYGQNSTRSVNAYGQKLLPGLYLLKPISNGSQRSGRVVVIR